MKKTLAVLFIMIVAIAFCFANGAEEKASGGGYPDHAVQVIVPLGAGGDTDLCARLFATYLEKELGQSVVVNNIKGAGGVTGSREVMAAAPDGYTVLFYQYASLVNMLTGTADFSYIDDFEVAGIAMVDNCYIWLGNGKSQYNSIADMVADAKANPGKVTIGLSGTGNMAQLSASVLQSQAGAQFKMVDCGSTSEEVAALLSNQIATYANYYSASKSYLESGDFKVLGVFADKRHPLLPDVPTMTEMGFDTNFLNTKYYYYAFPKGTPKEVVDAFSAAMKRVCENQEAKDKFFNDYYITLNYMNPDESRAYMKDVFAKYSEYKDVFKK
ncbi:MAG: tripartite tricarboxylate transporter substrate binding protein [Spirochaetales bacterium]|nr:tripartite tricarboxylate transporter substrate binding protein [Spirochaetales bacterium]